MGNSPRSKSSISGEASLRDKWPEVSIGIVTLLGVGLRLYGLDHQSPWKDELFSLFITDPALSLREFWDRVLADTQPPLYYLILRGWSAIFGQSDAAIRAPSVLFAILTLFAATKQLRPLLPPLSHFAFLLALAVSPGAITYGQEARPYSLLLLFATVITGASARFSLLMLSKDRRAKREVQTLGVAALLASFTHYFGFVFSIAAFTACLLPARRERRHTAIILVTASVVVACFLPWIAYHAQYIQIERIAWIAEFPTASLIGWFSRISFGGAFSFSMFLVVSGVSLVFGRPRTAAVWNPSVFLVCITLCLLTILVAIAVSLHTYILSSRNLIVLLPAMYLMVGEVVSMLVKRGKSPVAAVYLGSQVGLMGLPDYRYFTDVINEQWRESAAFVLNEPGCDAATIHVYDDERYYRHYTEKLRPRLRLMEIPVGATADLSHEPTSSCPILLWAVGVSEDHIDELLTQVGLVRSSVDLIQYVGAYVILAKRD